MGPDLTDKRWIVAKGILFAVLALLAGTLQILTEESLWRETVLLGICVWASCRFYYFLFHCLQAYVDPGLKSAGVMDLVGRLFRRGRVKLPAILRADELEHASQAWPPISRSLSRRLRIWLCSVTILIALVTCALPVLGMKLLFDEVPGALPAMTVAKILVVPLASPVLLMMLTGWIGYGVIYGKRIPFWLMGMGLFATCGIMADFNGVSHDFSHLIFVSCSGYGNWMVSLGGTAACSLATIWLLEFRVLRSGDFGFPRPEFQMGKNGKRAIILLAMLACWCATLLYLDIL